MFLDFQSFVKTSLTNLKYELKSMAFSIETLKNMMAQHVEHNSTYLQQIVQSNNKSVIVNESSEIVWPISNNEELNNVEKFLNNRLIRNNQVNFKSSIVNITI